MRNFIKLREVRNDSMTLNSSAVYRIGVAVFWNTSWNLPQSSQPVYKKYILNAFEKA
jgi:hypothetical protein